MEGAGEQVRNDMNTDNKPEQDARRDVREARAGRGKNGVLFLYNHSYEQEVRAYKRGEVPAHRLFGLTHMHLFGYQALRCPRTRAFRGGYSPLVWRVYQALYAALNQRRLAGIVATHESSALPALVLKKLGLLRTPIIVLNVALLRPGNCQGRIKALWKWCLPAADFVSSYASAQIPWLQEEFALPESKLVFTPLGVDTQFFAPDESPHDIAHDIAGNRAHSQQDEQAPQVLAEENSDQDFCLSVGTNEGKDFETLIAALPPGVRLEIYTDEANALAVAPLIEGKPHIAVHFRGTPIHELRRLYKQARFHVLPLREARYSSGQTVLLENMAMGRPIVISMTSGVRDYIEPGETVTAVEPGDVPALRHALEQAWDTSESAQNSAQSMARRAAQQAQKWSSEEFARKLAQLIANAAPKTGRRAGQ